MILRIATRSSELALFQARAVGNLIKEKLSLDFELIEIKTLGDRNQDLPIESLNSRGVFVSELRKALIEKKADLAVHSAKDLPSSLLPELFVSAVFREDPRDVLVGAELKSLKKGAVVLTGSFRRRAQMLDIRPDIEIKGLRGNISTRLSKIPKDGAIIMANAALLRLGIKGYVSQVFLAEQMVPQAGQGVIAAECLRDRGDLVKILSQINDDEIFSCWEIERKVLENLNAGCESPLGTYCYKKDNRFNLLVFAARSDSNEVFRSAIYSDNPNELISNATCSLKDFLTGNTENVINAIPNHEKLPMKDNK
jgi:hydroxymethylbilane synthase